MEKDLEQIVKAPEHQLRALVKILCADYEVRNRAKKCLDSLTAFEIAGSLHGKRKTAEGIQVCARCEDAFDPNDNKEKSCWYHPDDLEIDDESRVWDDWDYDAHGEKETENNRKAYPHGFMFPCCDKPGTALGCKHGHHHSATGRDWRVEVDMDSDLDTSEIESKIESDEESEEYDNQDDDERDDKVVEIPQLVQPPVNKAPTGPPPIIVIDD